ncbi:hypothetical protein HS088_TW19G00804 [Tripterygium wilfordii]|uniref:Mitochondrial transcription termination factor family protein n=1 Tax=Tripterygium wilfordii TaxID=458696 RepID=A0A7J7CAQ5_TRIWF|nr:uncharacterized protein LOC119985722 [Tripterygium wilfordii]KAF5731199.1 hypothetical protein HS088_TW19G00804 [Tripterygium wilfordii]
MLSLICKRLLIISRRERVLVPSNAVQRFQFYASKSKSGAERDEPESSFTVTYLLNSCGLPLETAKSLSKRVHFETPERPDSVLNLLKSYGFTSTSISKLISSCPSLLVCHAEKTLLPKLEFFRSKEFPSSDIVRIVCWNSKILTMSSEKYLIPLYDFLKSVLGNDQMVCACLKSSIWIFSVKKTLAPNVSLMREYGLPQSSISAILFQKLCLFGLKTEKLEGLLKRVLNIGFDPTKGVFAEALIVFFQLSKSTLERKMDVYRRWGWSDDEILTVFRKFPSMMRISEQKISSLMDFYLNRCGCECSNFATYPQALSFSLEKRLIPRWSVVEILLQKGLIEKQHINILYLSMLSDKGFVDKFLIKYQDQVPQIMTIFQAKVGLQELGHECENICR